MLKKNNEFEYEVYFGLFLSIILNHVIDVYRKKQNLKVVKKMLF